MDVKQAYNLWSQQYDTNENKTRDLEAHSLRDMLSAVTIERCLEIGCGTGKNTEWLAQKATQLTAVDLSEGMLAVAKNKSSLKTVLFVQADISNEWQFIDGTYDLITFSLVLEHIEDLEAVLQKAANALTDNGSVYIGELHPFKQYSGSKARFDTAAGTQVVTCFTHHTSDFIKAADGAGLQLAEIAEYFDNEDRKGIPRILALLFKKK